MNTIMIGLLSETSLHPGAESSGGVVDLPVARESTTAYPVLPGSGLKGALRDCYEASKSQEAAKAVFGKPDDAGGIAVCDGRLLLLPIRSLTGHYRWVTCSYIMERLQRDLKLAGMQVKFQLSEKIEQGKAAAATAGDIFLEELSFTVQANQNLISSFAQAIAPLIKHQTVRDRLVNQLVIVGDDDFKYLASYGLPVNARNVLDDKTKTSKNLWYEETVPPDTLFYSLVIPMQGKDDQLGQIKGLFDESPYLQVGGNETVGQGWCVVSIAGGE